MWAMMLKCIPQNKEGKEVFARLISQYNKVNAEGITYKLNEETKTEKHFDFKNTIIKELQMQVDLVIQAEQMQGFDDWIATPRAESCDAIDKQWREGVGGAQKLLPMHVVDEYCSQKRFDTVPEFTSRPYSCRQFYNPNTETYEDWFTVDSKFAIHKTGLYAEPSEGGLRYGRPHALDFITALCGIRTMGFTNLKTHLETLVAVDNQLQTLQI